MQMHTTVSFARDFRYFQQNFFSNIRFSVTRPFTPKFIILLTTYLHIDQIHRFRRNIELVRNSLMLLLRINLFVIHYCSFYYSIEHKIKREKCLKLLLSDVERK